jgi:tetratricopeptide (TPR) repeat protein
MASVRRLAATALGTALAAQAPLAEGTATSTRSLLAGQQRLELEDPVGALAEFRIALAGQPENPAARLGTGRAHLMLGAAPPAIAYARAMQLAEPDEQRATALEVQCLLRLRQFTAAEQLAASALERPLLPAVELLAAHASALFRLQQIERAAALYRTVLARDPRHMEANLRLGSGLLPPRPGLPQPPELALAVAAARDGRHEAALGLLAGVLRQDPEHPIARRLTGEVLALERAEASLAAADAAYERLRRALPVPDVSGLPVAQFIPRWAELDPAQQAIAARALALFARHLGRLVAIGARHDLLGELERTTDAEPRASLRGKRTFDGRVWDDVRGIGGLRAATGIEALDEARQHGFDTLSHEIAHQVHLFAFTPADRRRIREMYDRAVAEGRCLDYYAASNEAEYFGQGVEAFASYVKRPGREVTHGHTRFELWRSDRVLHDFIAARVDFDPLQDRERREPLLRAAFDVALSAGRPEDAEAAASMMAPSPLREWCLAKARAELLAARDW